MLCQGPAALLLCLGLALLPRHQGYGNSSLYGVQSSVTMSILLSLGDLTMLLVALGQEIAIKSRDQDCIKLQEHDLVIFLDQMVSCYIC